MNKALDEAGLNLLFLAARTHNGWLDTPVPDALLRRLYDVLKWAPTSANGNPARIIFLRTQAAKARLLPTLSSSNAEKTMSAPVTAIIAYDLKFHEKMGTLFPHNPGMRSLYEKYPDLLVATANRNSSLQGAYLILAARALGLDCGPMSGFDNAKVDQEFFSAGDFKSNFICNLGYGDPAKLYPRNPRLSVEEACTFL